MLVVITETIVIIAVLSVIGYLLLFGRGFAQVSKRFTDREARRSAAEEQARIAFAVSDLRRADDEGPQTD